MQHIKKILKVVISVSVLQFNILILPGMNTLIGYDLVPEPKILEAALRACRRLNDLASAIRILEAVKVREKPASVVLIIQRRLSTSIFAVVQVKGIIIIMCFTIGYFSGQSRPS